ncbi:MAG TPA: nitroreductase [Spongiibacteraceae bacterium]|nr:nitroreductase [Spongiibacteraceae bacterium]MBN48462.1 nitroreductase [Spongiibacteraceae bacterium]HCS26523.1 nitroreductase [Spongiibacteraceae bacterium]
MSEQLQQITSDDVRVSEFHALVRQRRSIRAFLPDPVSAETLQSVFDAAQYAPSNCNTQPWQAVVVSGAAKDRLKKRISEDFLAGKMTMDFPYDGKYEGVYKDRQYAAAKALYDALGITREDKAARGEAFYKNFEFFGAPHVAFLFLPEPFGIREAADLGMYAQNLMLSLSAHGLASCPQTALSFFADQIREELDIPASQKLLFGISFGVEAVGSPANACRTERAELSAAVNFINE